MFDFGWPWMGLLLPLPFLVRWLWPRLRTAAKQEAEGRQTVLLHPSLRHLQNAFAELKPRTPRVSRLHGLLLGLLWAALVVAMMQPQWLEPHTEIKTEGYDLMLAVDVSRSMEALDFSVGGKQVSRMAVIKGVAGRFVSARSGDRLGLIVFGNHAYVLSPLTLDLGAVRGLLDTIVPRMAGDGTAMGDAIGLGVKKLMERPEGSRVLVLVTDGESTAGSLPPLTAARLAASSGVKIYSIGVGSKGLVPFVEDGRLTQVKMEIDEELLEEVAQLTGGAYFRATDTSALEEIYSQIDALEKTEAEARSVMIPAPLYRWPLAIALVVLLMLGLFPGAGRRSFGPVERSNV